MIKITAEYIAPGNIRKIVLEYLIGSPELLIFALLIGVSYLSAKFQMSNRNFMLILIISSMVFAGILGEALYILILLIIGFVTYKTFARILS